MLLELAIENFALIEKIRISFNEGLNILTGETGAGKSILIDAVNMAIGERADKHYVRTGTDRSVIQLIFSSKNPNLIYLLKENGIETDSENILILTREIYNTGRSVCRINDRIVTVALIKEVSKFLIDIHGQHQHQSLLYPENHLEILDSFGEHQSIFLREEIQKKYYQLKELKNKLSSLYGNDLERERKIDLLKFQINEIDRYKLKPSEEEQLILEHKLVSNSEKIFSTISKTYEALSNGSESYPSIIDGLGHILSSLGYIKEFDNKILDAYHTIQDCLYKIEDVTRDMRSYRDHIDFNPETLTFIENRLNDINNLKRKYGKDITEILNYREKIFHELEEIQSREQIIKELKEIIDKMSNELLESSKSLSKQRQLTAVILEKKITEELKNLNMEKVVFKIQISALQDVPLDEITFTPKGIDKIEFLISTNAGEPLKPLSKIVSGGEMSRIMLAFKMIFAKVDEIPSLIFDEIDTGISGRTASIVGEKLAIISRTHQILCITHLPQIALMADTHYYIEKIFNETSTVTVVKKLASEEKVKEVGRLIGGGTLTELTLQHAKELLYHGDEFKTKLIV